MKLLPIIFLAIFCFYFFLFRNRVWFHHDDFDFLVGSANFNFSYLVAPHNEHFLPIFRILYYSEYSLFGLNFTPFFIISILLHLFILFVLYKITNILTTKKFYAYLAVFLFTINSTFFEVILWSTSQQLLLSSLFIGISFLAWLKYRQKKTNNWLITSSISSILAAFSSGFGVLYPLFISIVSIFDKKINKLGKLFFILSALLTLVIFWYFAGKSLTVVTKQSLSLNDFPHVIYFILIGLIEGMLSRFFWAPFTPSRIAKTDLILMPVLNISILIFLIYLLSKTGFKKGKNLFMKVVLASLSLFPYLAISLGRYPYGAKAAMSERYVYLPLFFFILFLIYQLSLLKQTTFLKKIIMLFTFWIILSHGVFFYLSGLRWTKQPLQSKKYMLSLGRQMKLGPVKADCKIPFYIKAKIEPCSKFLPILK